MTATKARSYRTLLVSNIPARRGPEGVVSDPLWSMDINTNAGTAKAIHLLCPLDETGLAGGADGAAPPKTAAKNVSRGVLDPRIVVHDVQGLDAERMASLIAQVDVVEIPGNFDWHRALQARRALKIARSQGKLVILGLSSNRAKTSILNAAHKSLPGRLRARLRAANIRFTQTYLARRADGVRVVGEGLASFMRGSARALHMDTASWIRQSDFQPRRTGLARVARVTIASRLEPMKGVHVGVEAMAGLITAGDVGQLTIIGVGAEEARLRAQVATEGLEAQTCFVGQLDYPGPFFDALRATDFVLLTNLNDEQPRLIFDAIAQGAIPICPRNIAYAPLGLDDRLCYDQGDPTSLRETVAGLIALPDDALVGIDAVLVDLAHKHTLEAMHIKRRDWILSLLG